MNADPTLHAPQTLSGRAPRPTARRAALLAAAALVLLAPAVSAVKRRAFVTSATGTGDLASWAGASGATALERADSICRYHAAGGQLPNWETYRAWISVEGTDAYCHLQGLAGTRASSCNGAPLPGGGPWYLPNGITTWGGTLDQMTGPEALLYRPLMLDEHLDPVSTYLYDRLIWTGTDQQGVHSYFLSCEDWTDGTSTPSGIAGDAYGVGGDLSVAMPTLCGSQNHLLCLEPGPSETVVQRWGPGALAFVTSARGSGDLGSWPEADGQIGVSAGYRICRNLAAAAHLPEPSSFVPWLSTTAVDAIDRLTIDGPFRRPDGHIVAIDAAELVGVALPRNSLHQFEDATYLALHENEVWTGTLVDGTAAATVCDNWTEGTAAAAGRGGLASVGAVAQWTDHTGYTCDWENRLYCFSNVITLFWDGFEGGTTARWSAAAP
jgi:hypothetical protein